MAHPHDRTEVPHDTVSIGVLGPLRIHVDGARVEISAPAQRTILGLLAIHAGTIVSTDEIVEHVWLGHPPVGWRNQIHVHLHRLLSVLEPGRAPHVRSKTIVRAGRGYRLTLAGDRLDLACFDELLDRAADAVPTDPARAEALYAQALACWRGSLLADDGDAALRVHPAAMAATRRRLSATLVYAELAIASGRHAEAERRLTELTADEPLHEGLHALLITALAGTGEQAAAVRHYVEIRERLIDELGIDPGRQIETAYRQLLRGGDAPTGTDRPVAPMQLPAPAGDFVGRDVALAQLDEWAAAGAPVLAITGGAGVGKTALAVQWARSDATTGRDQLYLNLRGYGDAPPVTPIEALSFFLRSLGVAPQAVPVDPDSAAALYRSMLARTRTLVVLDNANGPDQIRPLLPGGADSLVVITSRDRLGGMVALDGVRRLDLGVLEPEHALDLLGRMLGRDAVRAEAAAAEDLARACAYLPLALRIAAANITDRRYPSIAELSVALDVEGWPDPLEIDGDTQARVRVALEHSYAGMPASVQRLFRLLGLVPGPDITADVARALDGRPAPQVRRDLHALVNAHLIDQAEPDRFALHDLLRRYAAGLCATVDDSAARDPAAVAMFAHYLRRADAAARAGYPQFIRLPYVDPAADPDAGPADTGTGFADRMAALAWFDAERANLIAAIHRAAADGHHRVACAIADALRGYFSLRRHMPEWLGVARTAVDSATASGDGAAEVLGRISLSHALWWLGRRADAIDALRPAVAITERLGWWDALSACLGNLGAVYVDWGRPHDAAVEIAAAVEVNARHGTPLGRSANALTDLGAIAHDLGRLTEAVTHHARALELFEQLDGGVNVAYARANLGSALGEIGQTAAAEAHLDAALAVFVEVREAYGVACALVNLAHLRYATGDIRAASTLAARALAVAREESLDRWTAGALNLIGLVTRDPARHDEALAHAKGMHFIGVQVLVGRAQTLCRLDRLGEAIIDGEHALTRARRAGYRALEGEALATLADVHRRHGHHDIAAEYAADSKTILTECGAGPAADRTGRIFALSGA